MQSLLPGLCPWALAPRPPPLIPYFWPTCKNHQIQHWLQRRIINA